MKPKSAPNNCGKNEKTDMHLQKIMEDIAEGVRNLTGEEISAISNTTDKLSRNKSINEKD